jgi:predicted TIM-barrel fold metal-dependent hydrolase
MHLPRRRFLQTLAAAAAVPSAWSASHAAAPLPVEILDTHQHLWDLNKFQMAWLSGAPEVLRKSYGLKEYAEATRGLPVRALYMEVDVAEADLDSEASEARRICQEGNSQTLAAIVGGRPASDKFEDYLKRHGEGGVVKGVREVLHPADRPRGFCLEGPFVRGIRVLGKLGLTFDFCIRVGELGDAERLAAQCPETQFILDHCGSVDSKAFMKAPPTGSGPWNGWPNCPTWPAKSPG